MKVYVKYQIRTLEPVKMAAPGTQQGQEVSKNYIPGSSIRGAVIGEHLKECRKNGRNVEIDSTSMLREEFLTGTRFLNAYITKRDEKKERILIPTPDCFVADKQKIRSAGKEPMEVDNRLYENDKEGERVGHGTYCFLDDKQINIERVAMTANLHIQKAKSPDSGQMFRYEAIERGQVFTGFIQCEQKFAWDFVKLLDKKDFYIGGSKGSGYGKCKVVSEPQIIDAEDYYSLLGVKKDAYQGTLNIYALSDLILYNEYGMVANSISESFLQEVLGLEEVTLKKAFVTTGITSGYNHKHKAHSVQQTSVRAGSVYQYSYTGAINKEAVRRLEEAGVGLRKTEGYGCILIHPDFHQTIRVEETCEKYKNETTQKSDKPVSKESYQILMQIENKIVRQRQYDRIVYKLAYDKMDFMKHNHKWKLTRSQSNQLYKVLERIYFLRDSKSEDANKEEIKKYLDKHTRNSSLEATMVTEEKSLYTILEEMSMPGNGIKLSEIDRFSADRDNFHFGDKTEQKEQNEFNWIVLYLKSLVYYFMREEA